MRINHREYNLTVLTFIFTLLLLLPLRANGQESSAEGSPPVGVQQLTEVLWDQIENTSTIGVSSQNFSAFNTFDARAADDFEVPASLNWNIETVRVLGFYSGGTLGPAQSINVFFFNDNSGLPGDEITECTYLNIPPQSIFDPNFIIELPDSCILTSGLYWVSVQANMPFNPNGQWFWFSENNQTLSPFTWENPGNGSGNNCISWTPGQECIINPQPGPDLSFQLIGQPVPQPRPIPTLNQWALIAVASLLGIFGIIRIRKMLNAG